MFGMRATTGLQIPGRGQRKLNDKPLIRSCVEVSLCLAPEESETSLKLSASHRNMSLSKERGRKEVSFTFDAVCDE